MMKRLDTIEPGFYRVRMVKEGPWVPVEVRVNLITGMLTVIESGRSAVFEIARQDFEDAIVECVTDGDAFQHPLIRIAWFGENIDADEHARMVGVIEWAREHRPDHPVLHPTKPIKLSELPVDLIF